MTGLLQTRRMFLVCGGSRHQLEGSLLPTTPFTVEQLDQRARVYLHKKCLDAMTSAPSGKSWSIPMTVQLETEERGEDVYRVEQIDLCKISLVTQIIDRNP